jgi:hypothetical protein
VGKQVEQPLQLGGTGLQVRGELRPGSRPAAAQRVKQLAVVVSSPAEFSAGASCQRTAQAFRLHLSISWLSVRLIATIW